MSYAMQWVLTNWLQILQEKKQPHNKTQKEALKQGMHIQNKIYF